MKIKNCLILDPSCHHILLNLYPQERDTAAGIVHVTYPAINAGMFDVVWFGLVL